MTFAATVWSKLSVVNVNDHTEKKGNLTYLSWAWAWGFLMDHYPASSYVVDPERRNDDGTVMCCVSLTVRDGDETLTRQMWLPVMDNRNNAIANPTTRQISDCRMRCLVKAMAMFGLGHYIYAGEDLPEGEPCKKPAPRTFDEEVQALKECASLDELRRVWQSMDKDAREHCTDLKEQCKTELSA